MSMGWVKRLPWLFLGVLLLPACVAASRTLIGLAAAAHPDATALVPAPLAAMAVGYVLWLTVFFLLPKPVRTYVLAHELTHALWASAMGGRVLGMKVGASGGSVTVTRSNVFITLAPYFFPLYTTLVVAGYFILSLFCDVSRFHLLWLGVVGFTWGFHFTFTITMLMQHQPDIQEYGRLFSYAFIYLANVLGICLWMVMVSDATILHLLSFGAYNLRVCFAGCVQGALELIRLAKQ